MKAITKIVTGAVLATALVGSAQAETVRIILTDVKGSLIKPSARWEIMHRGKVVGKNLYGQKMVREMEEGGYTVTARYTGDDGKYYGEASFYTKDGVPLTLFMVMRHVR